MKRPRNDDGLGGGFPYPPIGDGLRRDEAVLSGERVSRLLDALRDKGVPQTIDETLAISAR